MTIPQLKMAGTMLYVKGVTEVDTFGWLNLSQLLNGCHYTVSTVDNYQSYSLFDSSTTYKTKTSSHIEVDLEFIADSCSHSPDPFTPVVKPHQFKCISIDDNA